MWEISEKCKNKWKTQILSGRCIEHTENADREWKMHFHLNQAKNVENTKITGNKQIIRKVWTLCGHTKNIQNGRKKCKIYEAKKET